MMANEKPKQTIHSLMTETRTFPPPPELAKKAHIKSVKQYQEMYDQSVRNPEKFWLEQAASLDWFKKPTVARK